MQSGKRYAAMVIEPHHDPAALGIDIRVLCTGYRVTLAATRHDEERLKWPRFQKFSDVAYHLRLAG